MFEPECTRPGPSEMIYDSRVGESDGMTFFIFYYPPHSTDCYTPLIIYLWLTHFYRIHAQDILFCRLPPPSQLSSYISLYRSNFIHIILSYACLYKCVYCVHVTGKNNIYYSIFIYMRTG